MFMYRRAVFSSVLMILLVAVSCQEPSAELQVPLENETVFLGGEAHFFCQVLGKSEDLRIRVNGRRILPPHRDTHNGVVISLDNSSTMDSLTVSAINIRIEARKANNNSVVECYDDTMGRESAPTATLTVKGGPAEPEVSYDFKLQQRLVVLSWPRPFTWEEYNITEYHIACRDIDIRYNATINSSDTLNRAVVSVPVKLPQTIPDCYTLYCNVTASNALDGTTAITNTSIPRSGASPRPIIQLVKPTLDEDGKLGLAVCVQLPILCSFQSVNYTVTISHDRDPVLEWRKEFSYSSGYSSECVEEMVTGGLEEGSVYTVQVFVEAGDSGNASSDVEILKPWLRVGCEGLSTSCVPKLTGGNASSADSEDAGSTGIVVDIAIGIVLLIVILILIIFACIILGLYRALRSNHRFNNISQRAGATNRVFDAYTSLSKVDTDSPSKKTEPDPVYHILEAPTSPPPTSPAPNAPEYENQPRVEEPVYHNPTPAKKSSIKN